MEANNKGKHLKDLLAKYRRGEHTPAEGQAIETWFASLSDGKESPTPIVPPDNLADSIYQNIRREQQTENSKPIKRTGRKFKWVFSTAATILLAFTVWHFAAPQKESVRSASTPVNYRNGDVLPGRQYAKLTRIEEEIIESPEPDMRIYAKNANRNLQIETPVAATYNIKLEDGTQVWINAGSTITYPEKFSSKQRRIQLNGEAYFNVAHDAHRPFLIEVNNTTIEVLGTTFNVNAYNNQVLTTLVEGSVKINTAGQSDILKPGEQALFSDEKIQISQADQQKNLAWQRGEFYFDGNNIQEICEQISRWYDIKFQGIEKLSAKSSFKGSIARNQNLSSVLNILSIATNGTFQIEKGTVVTQLTNEILNTNRMEKD